jgi:hypothetical protein
LDPFVFPLPPPPAADPPVELILLSLPLSSSFPYPLPPPPKPYHTFSHSSYKSYPSLTHSLTQDHQTTTCNPQKSYLQRTSKSTQNQIWFTDRQTDRQSRNKNKNTKGNNKDQATAIKIATSTESGRKRNRRWQMIHSKEETARE